MELTTVGARGRVCTYGLPVAIGLRNTKGEATERAKGNKRNAKTQEHRKKVD